MDASSLFLGHRQGVVWLTLGVASVWLDIILLPACASSKASNLDFERRQPVLLLCLWHSECLPRHV